MWLCDIIKNNNLTHSDLCGSPQKLLSSPAFAGRHQQSQCNNYAFGQVKIVAHSSFDNIIITHKMQIRPRLPGADDILHAQQLAASKVRKGAVGFGHLVGVFLLLEGSTGFVVGVNDFQR